MIDDSLGFWYQPLSLLVGLRLENPHAAWVSLGRDAAPQPGPLVWNLVSFKDDICRQLQGLHDPLMALSCLDALCVRL